MLLKEQLRSGSSARTSWPTRDWSHRTWDRRHWESRRPMFSGGICISQAWLWAAAAGIMLGLALLTKFTMLLLYAIWPFLWLVRLVLVVPRRRLAVAHAPRIPGHALLSWSWAWSRSTRAISSRALAFRSASSSLGQRSYAAESPGKTAPRIARTSCSKQPGIPVNRLRATWLGSVPCPLPEHYVLGFDEQKIETEGVPPLLQSDQHPRSCPALKTAAVAWTGSSGIIDRLRSLFRLLEWRDEANRLVALLFAYLVYKVPEGRGFWSSSRWPRWDLSTDRPLYGRRSSRSGPCPLSSFIRWASWPTSISDCAMFWLFSLCFHFDGQNRPLDARAFGDPKWVMTTLITGARRLTIAASIAIYPDYLAYFNWASGGPDRNQPRLIDSNLDWGQDLVALQMWWKETIPEEPIGLAYFGQINPSIFKLRGDSFEWFLPPVKPGLIHQTCAAQIRSWSVRPWNSRLVTTRSAWRCSMGCRGGFTILFRLSSQKQPGPAWNIPDERADAFWYFRHFEPIKKIGHSIYAEIGWAPKMSARVAPMLEGKAKMRSGGEFASKARTPCPIVVPGPRLLSLDILRPKSFLQREHIPCFPRTRQSPWKRLPSTGRREYGERRGTVRTRASSARARTEPCRSRNTASSGWSETSFENSPHWELDWLARTWETAIPNTFSVAPAASASYLAFGQGLDWSDLTAFTGWCAGRKNASEWRRRPNDDLSGGHSVFLPWPRPHPRCGQHHRDGRGGQLDRRRFRTAWPWKSKGSGTALASEIKLI